MGLGNPRVLNGEQVHVAGWENSHTHDPSYGGSGTGKGEAEDVNVVVAGPEAGQRYREGAGRRMVGDRRMIRKLGSYAVDREYRTSTGTGRQKPISTTAGFVVGDRRSGRSPGI